MLHIGKKIKEVLHERDMQVITFAKKINRSRNVVYDIFERQSLDTDLLKQIGDVLAYDFFKHYKKEKNYTESVTSSSVSEKEAIYELNIKNEIKLLKQENTALQNEIKYLKRILSLIEKKQA